MKIEMTTKETDLIKGAILVKEITIRIEETIVEATMIGLKLRTIILPIDLEEEKGNFIMELIIEIVIEMAVRIQIEGVSITEEEVEISEEVEEVEEEATIGIETGIKTMTVKIIIIITIMVIITHTIRTTEERISFSKTKTYSKALEKISDTLMSLKSKKF
jgi:hypothetical protein